MKPLSDRKNKPQKKTLNNEHSYLSDYSTDNRFDKDFTWGINSAGIIWNVLMGFILVNGLWMLPAAISMRLMRTPGVNGPYVEVDFWGGLAFAALFILPTLFHFLLRKYKTTRIIIDDQFLRTQSTPFWSGKPLQIDVGSIESVEAVAVFGDLGIDGRVIAHLYDGTQQVILLGLRDSYARQIADQLNRAVNTLGKQQPLRDLLLADEEKESSVSEDFDGSILENIQQVSKPNSNLG